MNEHGKHESSEMQDETEVIALLKRMQQQLAFLEKKIDILVNNQGGERSSQPRDFSRPFDRPHRREGGPRRGGFGQDRPRGRGGFGHRDRGERSFGRRDEGGPRDRGFDKPREHGGGFARKKKRFFER